MITIKITTNERGSFCTKLIQECNDISSLFHGDIEATLSDKFDKESDVT